MLKYKNGLSGPLTHSYLLNNVLRGSFPGVNIQRCWDLHLPVWVLKELLRILSHKLFGGIFNLINVYTLVFAILGTSIVPLTLIIYFSWFIYHIGHKRQTQSLQAKYGPFRLVHANFQNTETARSAYTTRPVV